MLSIFEKAMVRLAGNPRSQRWIERVVLRGQMLMGIGAGGNVLHSGEGITVELLCRYCSPPYCIFDVGSNTGQFAGLLLQRIGGQGFCLHCFEPAAEAFAILRDKFGVDPRFRLNPLALGSKRGQQTLYYDKPGSQLASLTKRNLEHFHLPFDKSEPVDVGTLDGYCAEHSVERIHLMKVDVEGHELDVFRGGAGMFERGKIDMVSFEFGGCDIDTRTFFRDFHTFFQGVRMSLHRITASGYLHPVPLYREVLEQFRTTNYLAVRIP
jgi:FkbM family methyltransferase